MVGRRRLINSQNIPVRDDSYQEVRRLFVAPPGMWFVKADYNQLELRVLAESSGDPWLVNAYKTGLDIHTEAANDVEQVLSVYRGVSYDTWMAWDDKDKRYFGKNKVNFPRVYGVAPPKMVEMANKAGLPLTLKEAHDILMLTDAKSPRVEQHRRERHAYIKQYGEERTLYDRRRLFPALKELDHYERETALREGFNHRIQGTAADLFKVAWVALEASGLLDATHRVVNTVHDEFDAYCPIGDYRWLALVKEVLESASRFKPFDGWPVRQWDTPLLVEITHGPNWVDQHDA